MNSVASSPDLMSSILGAGVIGDLMVEVCEFGDSGGYPLGSVMAKNPEGKVVIAKDDMIDSLYGILVEERIIVNLTEERRPTANVARRGSFRADQLFVHEGSDLALMAPRLRELGILLEGMAFAKATTPPPAAP